MTPLPTLALLGVARSAITPADRAWLGSLAGAAAFETETAASDLCVAWRRPGSAPEHAERGSSASGRWKTIVAGRLDAPVRDARALAERREAEGVDVLERVAGPCVGLLWSERERVAFRPASGRRPLYFALLAGGFAFASDQQSLIEHPDVGFSLDPVGAAQYLAFGFLLGQASLAHGVRCLAPGARLEATERGGRVAGPAWKPLELPRDEAGCVEFLDGALAAAVARAWSGARRPALCLSAGLDSRTLLAVAHRHGIPLRCVTNGIEGSAELRLAQRLCEVVGAEHLRTPLGAQLVERIAEDAATVASCSDGEGALQNVIMLQVGRHYRDVHAFDRVVRGHGGELLKLSLAYDFALPPELARSGDARAARDRILEQLSAAQRRAEGTAALQGDVAEALAGTARAFDDAWDALAPQAPAPAERAARLFLQAFNGRSTVAALRSLRQSVDVAQPFLDEEFVRALFSAPTALRLDSRLQLELIRRNAKGLLRVPDGRGGAALDASRLRRRLTSLGQRIARRLGAGRHDVPERWLIEHLDPFFRALLLEERSLSRAHVNADGLRALLARSPEDRARARTFVGRLAMLELYLRRVERPGPAGAPP